MDGTKHSIRLVDFSHLEVTGVKEVLSFDENRIELSLGELTLLVGGTELKIESFSRESGSITIVGKVDSMFSDEGSVKAKTGGLLSRFFS